MLQNFKSRRWTAEEDKKVLHGMARAVDRPSGYKNLAEMLGRSPGAVKMRYLRLMRKMGTTGQTAGLAAKMGRIFDKLIAAAQQTSSGRLTAADLEKIAKAERVKYYRVLSLWGQVNAHGFWAVKEMQQLRDRVAHLEKEIREREEMLASVSKTLSDVEEEKGRLETALREKERVIENFRRALDAVREAAETWGISG